MKRWAVLVVVLYFFILFALTAPLFLVAFYPAGKVPDALAIPMDWHYWPGLAVMVAGQAVMLMLPVKWVQQRPTSRRSVLWPLLAAGLMMGVLAVGVVICIDEFMHQEHAGSHPALPFAVGMAVWGAWSMVFYRTSRDVAPVDVVARQCRYLLQGSILELLVAVPTHIVARMRNYCCAGFYTFLGIAFGIGVMLFSFGPGVFFLFAARWRKLHPQPHAN